MQTATDYRTQFAAARRRWPFQALPEMGDEGLTFGRGTVLARCAPRVGDGLGVADGERIIALLSATFGRPVGPDVTRYVARAAARWRAGEKAMAQIELAFARLPRLATDADAWRLYRADSALAAGLTPYELLKELGLESALAKYSPDQPRVPAGSGRESGRWTSGGEGEGATADGDGVIEGRSRATAEGEHPVRAHAVQVQSAAPQYAANGPIQPDGEIHVPYKGVDPLDPMYLNEGHGISPEEAQAVADTLSTILEGDAAAVKKLDPHPYRNLPHIDTGAVLPPSLAGYRAYTVPLGQPGKGEGRILIDLSTGALYYTNTHYKSYYPLSLAPKSD